MFDAVAKAGILVRDFFGLLVQICMNSFFRAACVAHYCGANAYFTLFSWLPSYFTENYPTAQVSDFLLGFGSSSVDQLAPALTFPVLILRLH